MLDRAGRLTPGALRAAIARAVMEVAPEKARKRREKAAKSADVSSGPSTPATPRWLAGNCRRTRCWPPTSGSPPGRSELRTAGLEGDMDELRARAFLDLLLGKDSRPRQDKRRRRLRARPGRPGAGRPGPPPPPAGGAGAGGFAGRVTLTVPLATLLAWPTGPASSPGSGRSTRIPEQIHQIVTRQ